MKDASERTPSKGESATVESAAQQNAVSSAVSGQFQLLRDRLHRVTDSVKGQAEGKDVEDLQEELDACRAHLGVIETLVREYEAESEE
jgi:hypothetical protein